MSDEDSYPNMHRFERRYLLRDHDDPKRHGDLGCERNVERTFRVAGSLEAAIVSQRDCDEESGDAQHPQELDADLDNGRFIHAEDAEQLLREEKEEQSDDCSSGEA